MTNYLRAATMDINLKFTLLGCCFCLFADDTNIFNKNIFTDLIELKTNEDGSDTGMMLANLFQVLNTPLENRLTTLDERPYTISVCKWKFICGKSSNCFLQQ